MRHLDFWEGVCIMLVFPGIIFALGVVGEIRGWEYSHSGGIVKWVYTFYLVPELNIDAFVISWIVSVLILLWWSKESSNASNSVDEVKRELERLRQGRS